MNKIFTHITLAVCMFSCGQPKKDVTVQSPSDSLQHSIKKPLITVNINRLKGAWQLGRDTTPMGDDQIYIYTDSSWSSYSKSREPVMGSIATARNIATHRYTFTVTHNAAKPFKTNGEDVFFRLVLTNKNMYAEHFPPKDTVYYKLVSLSDSLMILDHGNYLLHYKKLSTEKSLLSL